MYRLTQLRSSAVVVLAAITLVVMTSHVSMIWHHAVPDFDTDTHIAVSKAGCESPWIREGMGDSAHPLGNALQKRWACSFDGSGVLTATGAWYLMISMGVVAVVALLLLAARSRGAGVTRAAVAIGFLGVAPAMRTLSNRAEEDWIEVSLLLLTALCISATHRTTTRWRGWLVAAALSTLMLALWHSQYLVLLAVGLAPWGVLALVRPKLVGTTRARALALGAAMAVPTATVLGLLVATGYVTRVPYQTMFFSIFNPDYFHGIVPWVRDYVAFSTPWLTGWMGTDGMEEKLFAAPEGAGFVLLGALALAIVVALAALTRDSLLMAVTFGAFALPFLYEPHNAERWSPATAMVALLLAVVVAGRPERSVAATVETETAEPEPAPDTTGPGTAGTEPEIRSGAGSAAGSGKAPVASAQGWSD